MSLYLNKDWFVSDSIQISHRSLTPRDGLERRGAAVPLANPVVFLANRHLKLTSVRVVPVSELATNKYAHPVWELNSQSNSVPVDEFVYGHRIPGMKPSVKGGTADPLLDDTRRLHAALRARGAVSEVKYYPGEPHAFHAFVFRESAKRHWRDTFAFLDTHVVG